MKLTCPECGQYFLRRKSIGPKRYGCPNCGVELYKYEGEWVTQTPGQKTTELFEHYEKVFEMRHGSPPLVLKRDKVEGNAVARIIIEELGGDLELAKKAIEVQFLHPHFEWATRFKLSHCLHDLTGAVAVARRKDVREKKESRVTDRFLEKVRQRENVFRGVRPDAEGPD